MALWRRYAVVRCLVRKPRSKKLKIQATKSATVVATWRAEPSRINADRADSGQVAPAQGGVRFRKGLISTTSLPRRGSCARRRCPPAAGQRPDRELAHTRPRGQRIPFITGVPFSVGAEESRRCAGGQAPSLARAVARPALIETTLRTLDVRVPDFSTPGGARGPLAKAGTPACGVGSSADAGGD